MHVDALTWALCTASMVHGGPVMTPEGVCSNRDRSTPIRRRETKGKVPHHLHSGTGEPAMTDGEPNTTASAGMAFPTTSFETKSTEAKHRIS